MVSEADRIRELEERLSQLERELARQDSGGRLSELANSLIPGEVREHMRAAWREQMLAVSAYLDHMAGKASDVAGSEQPGSTERRHIRVE
jgi:hypothetical protein